MVTADPKYEFPRNLLGYGEEGLDPKWPNGARIAVSICVNYEWASPCSIARTSWP